MPHEKREAVLALRDKRGGGTFRKAHEENKKENTKRSL